MCAHSFINFLMPQPGCDICRAARLHMRSTIDFSAPKKLTGTDATTQFSVWLGAMHKFLVRLIGKKCETSIIEFSRSVGRCFVRVFPAYRHTTAHTLDCASGEITAKIRSAMHSNAFFCDASEEKYHFMQCMGKTRYALLERKKPKLNYSLDAF